MNTEMMKAAVYTRYGPPEVVTVRHIPKPLPGKHEVLIKVHTSTVNRTDCGFRSAQYVISRLFSGLFVPRQQVLGCEFSGTVAQTGAAVTQYTVGDHILGFNDSSFGAHAEYMVLPESAAMATLPFGLSMDSAAALTEGAHYALSNLRAAGLKEGQQWLVNGATGAIGSAAIQLLKYFGAEVTAVCATPHMTTVKALGADEVIDYTAQDFTRIEKTFDTVFDAVGKSAFARCKPLLKPKGIYMSTELGKGCQNPFLALATPLMGGKKVLFPIPSTRKEDIRLLCDLARQKKFSPLMDRSYPLDDIVDAYRYVETGQKIGNVLLQVSSQAS